MEFKYLSCSTGFRRRQRDLHRECTPFRQPHHLFVEMPGRPSRPERPSHWGSHRVTNRGQAVPLPPLPRETVAETFWREMGAILDSEVRVWPSPHLGAGSGYLPEEKLTNPMTEEGKQKKWIFGDFFLMGCTCYWRKTVGKTVFLGMLSTPCWDFDCTEAKSSW